MLSIFIVKNLGREKMKKLFNNQHIPPRCDLARNVGWACIALLLFFSAAPESRAQNIIANGDFESKAVQEMPSYWHVDSYQPGAVIVQTSERVYQGKYALKIHSQDPNDARAVQTIAVKPNTFYRLSGYCWTEEVAPSDKVGANLCVMLPDYYFSEPAWSGTTGAWRKTEFVFKTTSSQSEITIGARLGMWNNTVSGTAFFDNICLEELTTPPAVFKQLRKPETIGQSDEPVPGESSDKHSKNWLWIIPLTMMVVIFVIYRDLKKD